MSFVQGPASVVTSNQLRENPEFIVFALLNQGFWIHLMLFQRAEIILPPLESSVAAQVLEIITATLSSFGWEIEKGSQPNKWLVSAKRNGNGSATQSA